MADFFGMRNGDGRRRAVLSGILLAVSLSGALLAQAPARAERVGVLVMAHGGDAVWNEAVARAVAPLRTYCPTVVALGMADRDSLQSGVDQLLELGADRIAVVRLFVSADSFREQTEYFLGLRPEPPEYFLLHGGHGHAGPHREGSGSDSGATRFGQPELVPSRERSIPPIQAKAQLALNREGLYDAPEMGAVMVRRVLDLSVDPALESVLVLAHGEGDDDINRKWMTRLDQLAETIRRAAPFRKVRVETLREDWKEKREAAEGRIREFVASESRTGKVIVVPFRVHGFGPYRQTLEGLDYVSDGRGLLPSPEVAAWIRGQAEDCFRRAGWPSPFPAAAAPGEE